MSDHRASARDAVREEMARRQWDSAELARATGLDPSTVGDFLDGSRWPRSKTLAKIDAALEWPAGQLDRISRGGEAVRMRREVTEHGAGWDGREPDITWTAEPGVNVRLAIDERLIGDALVSEAEEARIVALSTFIATLRELRGSATRNQPTRKDPPLMELVTESRREGVKGRADDPAATREAGGTPADSKDVVSGEATLVDPVSPPVGGNPPADPQRSRGRAD